ncbi:hypothetical protein [Streptomyces jumonjinensis]|uniref:hypothetical protein n=1 Tax=Streptomyces jumonjinensis TaxID=1945 RepID=UPI0037BA47A4
MNAPDQLPAWYGHHLAPDPQAHHTGVSVLAAHAGRAVPVITTSTALILARIWHEQGAAQSAGSAALMVALAAGGFAAGCVSAAHRNSDATITAVAFTASGAFAVIGPAAYTESWALAMLLWLVATVLVYAVSARHWRTARREAEARAHDLALARLTSATTVATAVIDRDTRAQSLAYGLMLAQAAEDRQKLDPTTYDPAALAGLPRPLPITRAGDIPRDPA